MAAAATAGIETKTRTLRVSRARLSAGHLVMVVAGLVGMTLTIATLRADEAGTAVAVATHEIRAGEVIRARDFRVTEIRAGRDLVSTLVGGRAARGLPGEIAVATIAENAVIPRGAVRAPAAGAGLRSMSMPIDPAMAVSGRLAAGDRIDVLFTDHAIASVIVTDAKVLAVDERGRGGIGESSSPFTVTIAVNATESLLVAAAIADGHISIARTTGAPSSQGTPPQSVGRATVTTVPGAR
jgi:Flp pilus assembly protein CpaB